MNNFELDQTETSVNLKNYLKQNGNNPPDHQSLVPERKSRLSQASAKGTKLCSHMPKEGDGKLYSDLIDDLVIARDARLGVKTFIATEAHTNGTKDIIRDTRGAIDYVDGPEEYIISGVNTARAAETILQKALDRGEVSQAKYKDSVAKIRASTQDLMTHSGNTKDAKDSLAQANSNLLKILSDSGIMQEGNKPKGLWNRLTKSEKNIRKDRIKKLLNTAKDHMNLEYEHRHISTITETKGNIHVKSSIMGLGLSAALKEMYTDISNLKPGEFISGKQTYQGKEVDMSWFNDKSPQERDLIINSARQMIKENKVIPNQLLGLPAERHLYKTVNSRFNDNKLELTSDSYRNGTPTYHGKTGNRQEMSELILDQQSERFQGEGGVVNENLLTKGQNKVANNTDKDLAKYHNEDNDYSRHNFNLGGSGFAKAAMRFGAKMLGWKNDDQVINKNLKEISKLISQVIENNSGAPNKQYELSEEVESALNNIKDYISPADKTPAISYKEAMEKLIDLENRGLDKRLLNALEDSIKIAGISRQEPGAAKTSNPNMELAALNANLASKANTSIKSYMHDFGLNIKLAIKRIKINCKSGKDRTGAVAEAQANLSEAQRDFSIKDRYRDPEIERDYVKNNAKASHSGFVSGIQGGSMGAFMLNGDTKKALPEEMQAHSQKSTKLNKLQTAKGKENKKAAKKRLASLEAEAKEIIANDNQQTRTKRVSLGSAIGHRAMTQSMSKGIIRAMSESNRVNVTTTNAANMEITVQATGGNVSRSSSMKTGR